MNYENNWHYHVVENFSNVSDSVFIPLAKKNIYCRNWKTFIVISLCRNSVSFSE